MTLSDDIKDDVDDVFLDTDEFAEQLRILHNGNATETSSVIGIVTWSPTIPDHTGGGRGTYRTGEVLINDDRTRRPVNVNDAFFIEGNRAEVTAVGPIQDGAQRIGIRQRITETKGATPRTGDI